MAEDPASSAGSGMARQGSRTGARTQRLRLHQLWYLLLLVEVIAVLIPSIYARITPKAFGIPFFYWYQLLWILISMVLTGMVYFFTTTRDGSPSSSRDERSS